MRQIVLDTETTGLEPSEGHRIIEIGCVELINRRLTGNNYHVYINPDRVVDQGAIEVHGITNEFLSDKPFYSEIVDDFMNYINGAELVIHNAPFDVGFMNHELSLLASKGTQWTRTEDYCTVLDTLKMARKMHPGKRNTLDALCGRYFIDNTQRTLHGALLDAEILADVYLAMTGGQTALVLDELSNGANAQTTGNFEKRWLNRERPSLPVIKATVQEVEAHQKHLQTIRDTSDHCVWDDLTQDSV